MKNNYFLPQDVFDSKIIVAIIKRGSFRKYTVENVTIKDGKLLVWYKTEDQSPGGATFNSALILAVEKNDYDEVVFMENGKQTAKMKIEE